jgi:hypothetical protein
MPTKTRALSNLVVCKNLIRDAYSSVGFRMRSM